jgi:hypothetical protein
MRVWYDSFHKSKVRFSDFADRKLNGLTKLRSELIPRENGVAARLLSARRNDLGHDFFLMVSVAFPELGLLLKSPE